MQCTRVLREKNYTRAMSWQYSHCIIRSGGFGTPAGVFGTHKNKV